jgi:hypothetical protein
MTVSQPGPATVEGRRPRSQIMLGRTIPRQQDEPRSSAPGTSPTGGRGPGKRCRADSRPIPRAVVAAGTARCWWP